MKRFGKFLATAMICVLAASVGIFAGCSQQSSSNQPDYADTAFIQSLAKGYEARSVVVKQNEKADKTVEYYEKLVDSELDQVEKYQSSQFEDSKLQESAIAYINALKDQRAAAEKYASDNDAFKQEWQKAYDKRTTLLKTFVEDYGMTVSSAYQEDLDKLISHGKKVENENNEKAAVEALANSIQVEFVEKYSVIYGQATVTNNTGYSFDNINFEVELFDANGVKVETSHMYATHWLAGETVVLDCYTSQKEVPASFKVVTSYYKVSE